MQGNILRIAVCCIYIAALEFKEKKHSKSQKIRKLPVQFSTGSPILRKIDTVDEKPVQRIFIQCMLCVQ